MTWWQSLLATAGVVGFWPAYAVVGDKIDIWWQRRQDALLQADKKRGKR